MIRYFYCTCEDLSGSWLLFSVFLQSSSPGIFIFSKANSADVIPELDLQNTTLKCVVPTKNDMVCEKANASWSLSTLVVVNM